MRDEIKCKDLIKRIFYIQNDVVKDPLLMVVYSYSVDIVQMNGHVVMSIKTCSMKSPQISIVKQNPSNPTKFMFGNRPFDLLDPWKGNQVSMLCLYRGINDFN